LLALLGPGDHLLLQDCLYGGTERLSDQLAQLGIESDRIDANRPESWAELARPNTRAIYVEAISNPRVQVADHRAVVSFARSHELISIIDNTFASPINFR